MTGKLTHQVAFLNGAAEASALEKQVEEDLQSVQDVDARYGKEFKTTYLLAGLAEKWASTQALIHRNSNSAKPESINTVYDDIVGKTILQLPIHTHIDAVKAFDDMLRRQVLDAGPSDFARIDLKSVTTTGLKTLESSYALHDASAGVLDDLLQAASANSINVGDFLWLPSDSAY